MNERSIPTDAAGKALNTIAGVDATNSTRLLRPILHTMYESTLKHKTRHVIIYEAPPPTHQDKHGHLSRHNQESHHIKPDHPDVVVTKLVTIPSHRTQFFNLTGHSETLTVQPTKHYLQDGARTLYDQTHLSHHWTTGDTTHDEILTSAHNQL